MQYKIEPIATIKNAFCDKFGIPRQSGLYGGDISTIIFEKQYRDENALRGLEEFSHIWLLWYFSETKNSCFSPTVRPPRLGGNKRVGVFATRSPYHPNRLGMSLVKLVGIEKTKNDGTVLKVEGADLMSGTPIIDIKPYLTFCDCVPEAVCSYADKLKDYKLHVVIDDDIRLHFDDEFICRISELLCQDVRPSYQHDKDRVYAMDYDEKTIKFSVDKDILTVLSIQNKGDE